MNITILLAKRKIRDLVMEIYFSINNNDHTISINRHSYNNNKFVNSDKNEKFLLLYTNYLILDKYDKQKFNNVIINPVIYFINDSIAQECLNSMKKCEFIFLGKPATIYYETRKEEIYLLLLTSECTRFYSTNQGIKKNYINGDEIIASFCKHCCQDSRLGMR